jgi:DNA-binding NtrC family response regulator
MLGEGGELLFGRDPDCHVALDDARVSRRHATLHLREGRLELVDLGSSNGTLIDGERAAPKAVLAIAPSSVVRIGSAAILLEEAPATPRPEQWVFERATFDARGATILAEARTKKASVGLLDIVWRGSPDKSVSTLNDGSSSSGIDQILVRIAGERGLIATWETGRFYVLVPEITRERLDESAALVQRVCDESHLEAEVRTALGEGARSVDVLMGQCTRPGGRDLVPPTNFQGALRSLDALLARIDASDSPILVVGETGVGKDVLARTLHARSRRAARPYIALNCAAFTEALFESELFGHERGAFTGANQAKTGLLEAAAGGTVFLDEIGEMPMGLQAKMLRVVENREVLRVGALQPKPIDVRFIFATNRDLQHEIEAKTFRADLFFRIGGITLAIPPLRERVDDIAPLAAHFIEQTSKRLGRAAPRLPPETVRFLEGHTWPGNVRELKNVIELAVLAPEGDAIHPANLHIGRYIPVEAGAKSTKPAQAPPPSVRAMPPSGDLTERERILEALEKCVWNQSEAAKLLGMGRRTLINRLEQYNIPRPRKRDP